MKTRYNYHQDPSHGWLAVKRAELIRLGLLSKVSRFSYQRGDTVYLEEDNDATIFLQEKQRRGEGVDLNNIHVDKPHRIRSYLSFQRAADVAAS
jgi:hypothetical protein